jgi:hypothetical protein
MTDHDPTPEPVPAPAANNAPVETPPPSAPPSASTPARADRAALPALLALLAIAALLLFGLQSLKREAPTAPVATAEAPVTLALPGDAPAPTTEPAPIDELEAAAPAKIDNAPSPHAAPAGTPTNSLAEAGGDLKSAAKEAAKTLGGLHGAAGGAGAFAAATNDLSKIANAPGGGLGDFARAAAALRALEAAALGGGPFGRELDRFRAADPDGAALEALRPWAEQGLPAQERLFDRLDEARRDALAAEAPLGLAASVRAAGDLSTAGRFDAAQASLAADDAAGAIAALEGLSPKAASAAQGVLADLKARAAARALLQSAADRLYGAG